MQNKHLKYPLLFLSLRLFPWSVLSQQSLVMTTPLKNLDAVKTATQNSFSIFGTNYRHILCLQGQLCRFKILNCEIRQIITFENSEPVPR
jgi:hypothetical protein